MTQNYTFQTHIDPSILDTREQLKLETELLWHASIMHQLSIPAEFSEKWAKELRILDRNFLSINSEGVLHTDALRIYGEKKGINGEKPINANKQNLNDIGTDLGTKRDYHLIMPNIDNRIIEDINHGIGLIEQAINKMPPKLSQHLRSFVINSYMHPKNYNSLFTRIISPKNDKELQLEELPESFRETAQDIAVHTQLFYMVLSGKYNINDTTSSTTKRRLQTENNERLLNRRLKTLVEYGFLPQELYKEE